MAFGRARYSHGARDAGRWHSAAAGTRSLTWRALRPTHGRASASPRGCASRVLQGEVDCLRSPRRCDRHLPDRRPRPGAGARGDRRRHVRGHRRKGHRPVGSGAGPPDRGHTRRRSGLRPARTATPARRHLRRDGQRRQRRLHRGRRQDREDRHQVPEQHAASERLPAHRQPGWTPCRRKLADLRRPPARRESGQRHRAAARDRRADADDPEVSSGQADARGPGRIRLDHA